MLPGARRPPRDGIHIGGGYGGATPNSPSRTTTSACSSILVSDTGNTQFFFNLSNLRHQKTAAVKFDDKSRNPVSKGDLCNGWFASSTASVALSLQTDGGSLNSTGASSSTPSRPGPDDPRSRRASGLNGHLRNCLEGAASR